MAQETEAVKGQEPAFDDKALVEKVVRDVQQAKREAETSKRVRRRRLRMGVLSFWFLGLGVIAAEAWYLAHTSNPPAVERGSAAGQVLMPRQVAGAASMADVLLLVEAVRAYRAEHDRLPMTLDEIANLLPGSLGMRAASGSLIYHREGENFTLRLSDPEGPDIVYRSDEALMHPLLVAPSGGLQ